MNPTNPSALFKSLLRLKILIALGLLFAASLPRAEAQPAGSAQWDERTQGFRRTSSAEAAPLARREGRVADPADLPPAAIRSSESESPESESPAGRQITPPATGEGSAPFLSGSRTFGWVVAGGGIFVLAALAAFATQLRRNGFRLPGQLPPDAVEVLGRTRLEARSGLVLVRIGRRVLAVGSSAGELTTLAEITDPEEVGELVRSSQSTAGSFSTALMAAFTNEPRSTRSDRSGPEPSGSARPEAIPRQGGHSSPAELLAERLRQRSRPAVSEETYGGQ